MLLHFLFGLVVDLIQPAVPNRLQTRQKRKMSESKWNSGRVIRTLTHNHVKQVSTNAILRYILYSCSCCWCAGTSFTQFMQYSKLNTFTSNDHLYQMCKLSFRCCMKARGVMDLTGMMIEISGNSRLPWSDHAWSRRSSTLNGTSVFWNVLHCTFKEGEDVIYSLRGTAVSLFSFPAIREIHQICFPQAAVYN